MPKESPPCTALQTMYRRGGVVGRLTFYTRDSVTYCSKGRMCIPINIDSIWKMESDAMFILLVEKYDSFFRLHEDRFYERFPCIVVATATGKGADLAALCFLKKITAQFHLPVFAVVDSDPRSLNKLLVYMCGSKYKKWSSKFAMPDIKWLGIRPSDVVRYNIPVLPMTTHDITAIKDLLEKDFVKKNPGWVDELNIMLKRKRKGEIEAFAWLDFRFLTDVFLPLKFQEKDWI